MRDEFIIISDVDKGVHRLTVSRATLENKKDNRDFLKWMVHRGQALLASLEAAPDDENHDDAEIVEHLLGEEAIRRLEEQLGFPESDPHGKPIPVPEAGAILED